jgi:hypothetical protein
MRCNISSKRRNRQFRRAHDDADRHGCIEEHSHCVFVGFVVNLHNGNTLRLGSTVALLGE